ncbi:uncharacterized protein VTP21DRAFT_2536 [Calcarisporiella thermophila]|uniref:uncharacterized protein n=1 Tax=Calcarisporiella thermophila TaxID=911321 RepID=UPI0037431140
MQARLSFLVPADQIKFEQLFAHAVTPGERYISGPAAREILLRSNLPGDVLAKIWVLSNVTHSGSLTFPEFALAMYLTSQKLQGKELPQLLPDALANEVRAAIQKSSESQPIGTMGGFYPPTAVVSAVKPLQYPYVPSVASSVTSSVPSSPTTLASPASTLSSDHMDFVHKMLPPRLHYNAIQSMQPQSQFWTPKTRTSSSQSLSGIPHEERLRYKQLFTAWDQNKSGYLSGDKAKEIFSQSGLPQHELMRIWNLADSNNRGKLNQAEFDVAMYLIYRRLNGGEIPTVLPPNLVPPATHDLQESVDLVKMMFSSDRSSTGDSRRSSLSVHGSGMSGAERPASAPTLRDDRVEEEEGLFNRRMALGSRAFTPVFGTENPTSEVDATRPISGASVSKFGVDTSNAQAKRRQRVEHLQEQINEQEAIVSALTNQTKDFPPPFLSPADKHEIEELKHQIRLLHVKANRKAEFTKLKERSSILGREIENHLKDLHQIIKEVQDTELEIVEKKRELCQAKYGKAKPWEDNEAMTEQERVRAKAQAMLAARLARLTGQVPPSAAECQALEEQESRIAEEQNTRTIELKKVEHELGVLRRITSDLREEISQAKSDTGDGFKAVYSETKEFLEELQYGVDNGEIEEFMERFPADPTEAAEVRLPSEGLEFDEFASRFPVASELINPLENGAETKSSAPASTIQPTLSPPLSTPPPASDPSPALQFLQGRVASGETARPIKSSFVHEATSSASPDTIPPLKGPYVPARKFNEVELKQPPLSSTSKKAPPSIPRDPQTSTTLADRNAGNRSPEMEEKPFSSIRKTPTSTEEKDNAAEPAISVRDKVRQIERDSSREKSTSQVKVRAFGVVKSELATSPQVQRQGPRQDQGRSQRQEVLPIKPVLVKPNIKVTTPSPGPPSLPAALKPRKTPPPPPPSSKKPGFAAKRSNSGDKLDVNVEMKEKGAASLSMPARQPSGTTCKEDLLENKAGRPALLAQIRERKQLRSTEASNSKATPLAAQPEKPLSETLSQNKTKNETILTPTIITEFAENGKKVGERTSPRRRPLRRGSIEWFGGLASDTAFEPRVERERERKWVKSQREEHRTETKEEKSATDGINVPAIIQTTIMERDKEEPEEKGEAELMEKPSGQELTNPEVSSEEAADKEEVEEHDVDYNQEYQMSSLYHYNSERPDELGFEAGVRLKAYPPLSEDIGWWYGVLENGECGWFPRSYVTEAILEENGDKAVRSTASKQSCAKARVLYDYRASQRDELSIRSGTIISIIDRCDPNWWRAEYAGAEGLVPSNYVDILSEDYAGNVASPSDAESPTLSPIHSRVVSPFVDHASDTQYASKYLSEPDIPSRKHSLTPPPPSTLSGRNRSPSLVSLGAPYKQSASTSVQQEESGSATIAAATVEIGRSKTRKRASSFSPSSRIPRDSIDSAVSERSRDSLAPPAPAESALQRPDSPLLQTWAATVDPSVLGSISVEERKRQEAIFELIQTERSYLRDLQIIIELYFGPMCQFLAPHELDAVFGNIQDILLGNTAFFSDLEERQREGGAMVSEIGDIFLKHVAGLESYREFCKNMTRGSQLLQKKRKEDKKLAEFLAQRQATPECRNLDLSTYLLKPMQRITRYPLLLRQIFNYTPDSHPDHGQLDEALKAGERVLNQCNEAARMEESRQKLAEISKNVDLDTGLEERLDLSAPTRLVGPRQFLMEGPLAKVKSGRKLYGYLFNDLILLVQPSRGGGVGGLYRAPILLNELVVRDIPPKTVAGQDDACFQIVHIQDMVSLRAPDLSSKRQWFNQIQSASLRALAQERKSQTRATPPERVVGSVRIVVVEAQVPSAPNVLTTMSAYCELSLGPQVLKTRVVRNSVSPFWDQAMTLGVPEDGEGRLRVSLYSYHRYSPDEYLGGVEVRVAGLGPDAVKRVLPLENVPDGCYGGNVSLIMSYHSH